MGRSPKAYKPPKSPAPIPPATRESEDIMLAQEAATNRRRRQYGRPSTLIAGTSPYGNTSGKTTLG